MNEQQLRERMSDLVGDQPPMRHGSADDLRRGRKRVVVRRAAVGASGAAAAGLVVTAVIALSPAGTAPDNGSQPAGTGSQTLLERCTQIEAGALDPQTFGPGSQVVTQASSAGGDVSAVLLSADGRTWGECHLYTDPGAEFDGAAIAYPMQAEPPTQWGMETNSMGFGNESFDYVDRFPADVARVTVDVGGGTVLSAQAVDGFVAFQEDVPGLTVSSNPSFDVTLYGADGEVLADKSMAPGDASLPVDYRTLVPDEALPAGGAGR